MKRINNVKWKAIAPMLYRISTKANPKNGRRKEGHIWFVETDFDCKKTHLHITECV